MHIGFASISHNDGATTTVTMMCSICCEKTACIVVTTLACRHVFCQDCLTRLCVTATKDERLLPASCCNHPIPEDAIMRVLSPQQWVAYNKAVTEHRCTNRMYCPNQHCSAFVGERAQADRAPRYCEQCGTCFCESCACLWDGHGAGVVCSHDRSDEKELQALAKLTGWQQCARCRRVIERDGGCNHMVCYCSYEFCYVCGAPSCVLH